MTIDPTTLQPHTHEILPHEINLPKGQSKADWVKANATEFYGNECPPVDFGSLKAVGKYLVCLNGDDLVAASSAEELKEHQAKDVEKGTGYYIVPIESFVALQHATVAARPVDSYNVEGSPVASAHGTGTAKLPGVSTTIDSVKASQLMAKEKQDSDDEQIKKSQEYVKMKEKEKEHAEKHDKPVAPVAEMENPAARETVVTTRHS